MMLPRVALLTMMAGVVVARIREEESGSCPQLESDWQDKLDNLIEKIPKEIRGMAFEDDGIEFKEPTPGLFLSTDFLVGLDNLKPDRPYQTFCRDDVRIIVFSVSSDVSLRYYIPWKLCSGHNGSLSTEVSKSRFQGEIVVTRTGDRTEWKVRRVDTRVLEGVQVKVEGLGETVAKAANWVDLVFSGTIKAFWMKISQKMIASSMMHVGERENIRFGQENAV